MKPMLMKGRRDSDRGGHRQASGLGMMYMYRFLAYKKHKERWFPSEYPTVFLLYSSFLPSHTEYTSSVVKYKGTVGVRGRTSDPDVFLGLL